MSNANWFTALFCDSGGVGRDRQSGDESETDGKRLQSRPTAEQPRQSRKATHKCAALMKAAVKTKPRRWRSSFLHSRTLILDGTFGPVQWPRMPFRLGLMHFIKKQVRNYNKDPLRCEVFCVVINIVGQINSISLAAALHFGLDRHPPPRPCLNFSNVTSKDWTRCFNQIKKYIYCIYQSNFAVYVNKNSTNKQTKWTKEWRWRTRSHTSTLIRGKGMEAVNYNTTHTEHKAFQRPFVSILQSDHCAPQTEHW